MKLTFDHLSVEEALRIMKAVASEGLVQIDDTGPTPSVPEEEQPQKPRRQRRTKAEMEEARAAEAESNKFEEDVQAAAQEVQEEIDAAEPAPRRRRKGAPEAEAEEKSTGRRRRRSAPAEDPTDAPPAGRRRRGSRKGSPISADAGQSEDPVDSPPPEDEITDRDVSKAASEGAQELTPAIVREVLDQFGVGNVADLDQGQRREFIDMIDAEIVRHK